MFDPRLVMRDFAAAAPNYDRHARLQRDVQRELAAMLLLRLRPDAHVLDVGGGTGGLTLLLPGCPVVHLDQAWLMCAEARAKGETSVCASAVALPVAKGAFDAVFSSLMLQWLPADSDALAEMRRVTRHGGIGAFATFGAGSLRELAQSFAAVDAYPHVSPFVTPSFFAKACHAAGWRGRLRRASIVEHYPDVRSVLSRLRGVGARNKHPMRRRSLLTPRQFARAEAAYEAASREPPGLRVSWEILMFTGEAA